MYTHECVCIKIQSAEIIYCCSCELRLTFWNWLDSQGARSRRTLNLPLSATIDFLLLFFSG